MNKLKVILWDWNGTLLDDLDIVIEVMRPMLAKRGLNLIDKKKYQEIFTFPVIDYYHALGFDFSKETFEQAGMEYINGYQEKLDLCRLAKGAKELLAYFKEHNIRQGVLSAMEQKILIKSVQDLGITDYFDWIAGLDNHWAHSKAETGLALMKKIQEKPENICLVGDTTHDAEVADKMGINCILVADGHMSRNRLAATGKPVVNNLMEIKKLIPV
jgi:phosphoglycolate phosphatase